MLRTNMRLLLEDVWPAIVADVPICLWGKSAVGKSQWTHETLIPRMEAEYGQTIGHDIRVSSHDQVDANGLPVPNLETMTTRFTRSGLIPDDDGKMHLFICDEAGHASRQQQHSLLYPITRDRMLGGKPFPKLNRVILITNTAEAKGGDSPLVEPLNNRMFHYVVEPELEGTLAWFLEHNVDPRLHAFMRVQGHTYLHRPDPQGNPAWSSPRTMEYLNKVLRGPHGNDVRMVSRIAQAACGEAFAADFAKFLRDFGAKLPSLAQIKANPATCPVPDGLDHQYLIQSAIASVMNVSDAEIWAKYLARLSPDIASACVKAATLREPALESHPALKSLVM